MMNLTSADTPLVRHEPYLCFEANDLGEPTVQHLPPSQLATAILCRQLGKLETGSGM